jgi:branched-chain amino acid transport system permease protein
LYSYNTVLLGAIAVALVAGFRSFSIMLATAFVVAGIQALLLLHSAQLNDITHLQGWGTAFPLLLVIGVVLRGGRGIAARGHRQEQPLQDVPRVRHLRRNCAILVAGGAAWYLLAPTRLVDPSNATLIATILAMSVVLLTGYAGQISLAQLSIAGVGAFAAGKTAVELGLPFPLPILVGGICAGLFALIIGAPALRVRGLNLAVVTLGAAIVLEVMFFGNASITGADAGIPVPRASILGMSIDGVRQTRRFGVAVLVIAVAIGYMMALVRRSSFGQRLLAIRANERGAAAAGISVARTKLAAFALSGFVAGIAGSLQGYRFTHLSWEGFDFNHSILLVAYAYLGGVALLSGAVVAGLLMFGGVVTQLIHAQGTAGDVLNLLGGLGVISIVLQHPDGLGAAHRRVARVWAQRRGLRSQRPTSSETVLAGASAAPLSADRVSERP